VKQGIVDAMFPIPKFKLLFKKRSNPSGSREIDSITCSPRYTSHPQLGRNQIQTLSGKPQMPATVWRTFGNHHQSDSTTMKVMPRK
jgi:hypothetical protein